MTAVQREMAFVWYPEGSTRQREEGVQVETYRTCAQMHTWAATTELYTEGVCALRKWDHASGFTKQITHFTLVKVSAFIAPGPSRLQRADAPEGKHRIPNSLQGQA